MVKINRRLVCASAALLALVGWTGGALAATFSITRAEWSSSDGGRLRVEGAGTTDRTVTIRNAGNNATLGTDTVDEDEQWSRGFSGLTQVPCTVSAQQSGSTTVLTRNVSNAPSNCGPVAGRPSLSVGSVSRNEGNSGTSTLSFTVSLSAAAPSGGVSFSFATANGTATSGSDYVAASGTRTIAAGSTSTTISVTINGDTAVEPNETFTLNISGATNTSNATASATGTINNDDQTAGLPTLSVAGVSQTEGNSGTSTFNFAVTLSAAAPTGGVTFNFATANGTATAGSDYVAVSTTPRTIAAGATSATVSVTVNGDTAVEPNETFTLNITGATNTTNATASATGTIVNDDSSVPSVSINDVTVTEGQTATFAVSLSPASTQTVTVVASTANGTATSPDDYTARSNVTLTFAAGVTTQTFTVATVNDTAVEPTETLSVNLTGASSNAAIGDAQGLATINDNDLTVSNPAHLNITNYEGPQTCLTCHEAQARKMHGSVHYPHNGPTDFVTNIAGTAGEGPAGRVPAVNTVIGINTYCGTHQSSPRFTCAGCHVGNGRYPKTPTELAALDPANQLKELSNIDCLKCHQQVYKRFPDWTATGLGFSDLVLLNVALDANGNLTQSVGSSVTRTGLAGVPNVGTSQDFMFRPAGAPGSVITLPADAPLPGGAMTLTTEQAAQSVHRTTRQSCLNCHAGAAGANGAKRGDLSTANIASTDLTLDRHMATTGSNMTCSACHNVNDAQGLSLHRVRGRGLDLRANDVTTRFTCDNAGCHNAATVHSAVTNGATFTRHANKVACQTCHIPRYGKGVATEIARDWQKPHLSQTACNGRGGWLPEETKSSAATPPVPATPSYQWFDGTSQVYYLTEPLTSTPTKPLPANIATPFGMATGTGAYMMGRPNPATAALGVSTAAAKLYPMKEHWGKLARNTANNTLIAHSTYEFFRTGSFCRAVAQGLGQNADTACGTGLNSNVPSGAQVVPVHTYQTINHGVEPQANALGANNTCGACHSVGGMTGGPARMDLKGQLGYAVSTTIGWTVNATTGTSTCSNSCHSSKSASFTSLHSRSQHVNAGCRACHSQITGR